MKYNLLQQDIEILKQSSKELYSKVELLNRNKKILANIKGELISDSISIDAESDIRRTYSCEMKFSKSNWNNADKYKLMTYYIVPYVGIKHIRLNKILWYKLGTFAFDSRNFTYDETNTSVSFQCLDLMSYLNGTLGGELKDQKIEIEVENNIRNVIISLLNECGITEYNICEMNHLLPYDKEYSSTTYYAIIKELLDLYAGYEMYFDIDGIFTIDEIPTCEYDDNILDDTIIEPLLISQSGSFSYENIYNHIKIYGTNIETNRYTEDCTYANNVYNATIETMTTYENFETYSIKLPSSNLANAKLNINNIGAKNIVKDDGVLIKENDINAGTFSFRYRRLTDDFLLLGQYQVIGEAWDTNPESPFNINNLGYEIYHEYSEGEYSNIYSNELANQRARYEIWLSTNIQNNLTLEMMFIPWLDVNTKIEYTDREDSETHSYIVKRINGSFMEGTMTIDIIRFYENYPNII